MPRTWTRLLLVAGSLIALAVVSATRATPGTGTLYSLRQDGLLRSLDPTSGAVRTSVAVSTPGKVVRAAHGLAIDPRDGALLALLDLTDDCTADLTRTRFLYIKESCWDLDEAECERAFSAPWARSTPASCFWTTGRGCRPCDQGEDGCLNTCVAPPPCEGSTRTIFGGAGESACRRHDGDEAQCATAYYARSAGMAACFFEDGKCLGCDPVAEAAGRCGRECDPPITCTDQSRVVHAGDYGGCRLFDGDSEACAIAYVGLGTAYRCQYEGSRCDVEDDSECTPEGPACPADPTRDVSWAPCYTLGTDRDACERTVAREDDGIRWRGCFFAETEQTCRSCTAQDAAERHCVEPCDPPICREDPERTLAGLDETDCRAFDGNAAACADAFVQGQCGPASCTFDAGSGECRACEPGDPGACANACGEFQASPPLSLVRVDPTSGAATVLREVPGGFEDLAVDATGRPYSVAANPCYKDSFLHDLAPERVRPTEVLDVDRGDGIAFGPDGLLYRLKPGFRQLLRYDLTSKERLEIPVPTMPLAVPGFAYVEACNAFLAATRDGTLARVERNGVTYPVGYALPDGVPPGTNYGPEIVGLAASPEMACPPETPLPPTTTTIPSERLRGSRLVLTDPARPGRRRLLVLERDPGLTLGRGEASPDDPMTAGASLHVRATATGGFTAVYPLEGRWQALRKSGELRGYRWSGPPPITSVVVKAGRAVRVVGRGDGLPHSLSVDPGSVAVDLVLGERPYCVEFGGDVRVRTPRRFEAVDAPAPAFCREAATAP